MPGRWADLIAQSIVHALVAALVVEALIRVWRVGSPKERLGLRLLALGQPLAVSPALVLLLPWRAEEEFHQRWALFSGRHWEDLRLGPWSLFEVFVLAMAALGLALFLVDFVPLLRRLRHRREESPAPPELENEVVALAARARISPPPVRIIGTPAPAIYCAGVMRPALLVSPVALDLLDAGERRAALAHELAHVALRDPLASWVLVGARALLFFNPVAQVLARSLSRESEARADEAGGALSGDGVALASALLKLYRAGGGPSPADRRLGAALAEVFHQARVREVAGRCRRLLGGGAAPRSPLARLRLALTALAVPALLLFVT